MVLEVKKYGEPILRKRGAKITEMTDELRKLIEDMFDTMHDARGIGLAAQQIGRALQLALVDVTGVEDRPSTLQHEGKEVDVEEYMPLVLINPELTPTGDPVAGPEGCLSFPELYGDVSRPESIHVKALDEEGDVIEFDCGGLLARVIQHETDHLNGILYIDRMATATKQEIQEELDTLQAETKEALKKAG